MSGPGHRAGALPRDPHPYPSPQGGGEDRISASAAAHHAAEGRAAGCGTDLRTAAVAVACDQRGRRALTSLDLWRLACGEAGAMFGIARRHVAQPVARRGGPWPLRSARDLALWIGREAGIEEAVLARHSGLDRAAVVRALLRIDARRRAEPPFKERSRAAAARVTRAMGGAAA